MFNRVEKCLEEISQIKSEGGKVFFHSSDSDHMLDGYLVPDVGPWVKQVIDGSIDSGWEDSDIEELYEKSSYVYMSEIPKWVEIKAKRGGGLEKSHLGVILLDSDDIDYIGDDIIHVGEFSNGKTLSGLSVEIEGVGPEPGDWISTRDIPVKYEFTGEELKEFLKIYENGKYYIHAMDELFESIHNAYSAIFESVEEIQEQFNERFWISPEYLYHATSKSNVNSIMEYGIVSDKFGKRKLMGGNRARQNQRLIFTVTEDGIDKISRYGDVILKIDTKAMKLDGFIPNVSMEDDLAEYYDSDEDLDVNMSDFEEYGTFEETVILEVDKIPPKYVTVLTNYQEDEPELNWNTVLSSYEENDEINQFIKDNIDDLDWTHLYGYNSFPKYIQNNKFVQERILELIEESVDLRKASGAYNEQKFLSNLIDRYKFPLSLISKANI